MFGSLYDARSVLGTLQGSPKALYTLHKLDEIGGFLRRLQRQREARQELGRQIKALALDGRVGVVVWSRDCDHVCGESRYEIEANVKAWDAFVDRKSQWADGPMSFSLSDLRQPFRAWSRDMAAEAHEDGHPYSVSDAFEE